MEDGRPRPSRSIHNSRRGTPGGPIRRNRAFFFAGFDRHIFQIPNVVRFLNGRSVLVPQAGAGPETPGDYEASDQALVFATAAQLSKQAGTFPSSMIGNAGFFKLDFVLNQHNNLTLRCGLQRVSRRNAIDPASHDQWRLLHTVVYLRARHR